MLSLKKVKYLSNILNKNYSLIMRVNIPTVIKSCFDEDAPSLAASLLLSGEVIALPTDTIYGLACSANSSDAIKKLYSIKGRDSTKPVAICVSHINDIYKWGITEHLPKSLFNEILPGAVTIVLKRTDQLNQFLNPSTSKIGIRIPDHGFVNNITTVLDLPMALTSANFSNEPSTLSVDEFKPLHPQLGAVFDGGRLMSSRSGSTVVDLSSVGYYTIVRKGATYEKIIKTLKTYGIKEMDSNES